MGEPRSQIVFQLRLENIIILNDKSHNTAIVYLIPLHWFAYSNTQTTRCKFNECFNNTNVHPKGLEQPVLFYYWEIEDDYVEACWLNSNRLWIENFEIGKCWELTN